MVLFLAAGGAELTQTVPRKEKRAGKAERRTASKPSQARAKGGRRKHGFAEK